MDLDKFYSDNPVEVWEKVLGSKMHYHFADDSNPNEDPFDQSVINLFPFIKPNSKILDCGCGWGGPARLIKNKLNCDVVGITNSKSQYEYVKDFPIEYADIHNYIPTQKYDLGLFLETATCMDNLNTVFNNLKNAVSSILIVDFLHQSKTLYVPEWGQHIRCKKDFVNPLENNNYIIKHFSKRKYFFQPSLDYWSSNIEKLDPRLITGQLFYLYEFCKKCKTNNWSEVDLCTIYATK